MPQTRSLHELLIRCCAGTLISLLPGSWLVAAQARIDLPLTPAAGAQAGQKPLIDAARNGVPLVHIAPPSAAGVSRNQYDAFNVNADGLIFNNSVSGAATAVGGWVGASLQLGPTPARIILNEVVSARSSELRGPVEIAGPRAGLVIANPNGLSCNGCTFLNSARVSLTSGVPRFAGDGNLSSLDVRQGVLRIGPDGLSASHLERLDLVARGVEIEGEVRAQHLDILAGANDVIYDTLRATAQDGGGAAPRFAVDVKAAGGMYADRIYLRATEQGLGVNSSGRLAALQGNLEVSANGDLTLKDSYAKRHLELTASGATTLTGETVSEGGTRLHAAAIKQEGTLDSRSALTIAAPQLENTGTVTQRSATPLELTLGEGFTNRGALHSGGDLTIATPAGLDNRTGQILAAGTLTVDAHRLVNNGGELAANGAVRISAPGRLENRGGTLSGKTALALSTAGTLDNSDGLLISEGALTLNAAELIARRGAITAAHLSVSTTGTAVNTQGMIQAERASLSAAALQNQAGLIAARDDLELRLGGGRLDNQGGEIIGLQRLAVLSGEIDNTRGTLATRAALTLDTQTRPLTNSEGKIVSAGDLTLTAGRLTNIQGTLASRAGALRVDSRAAVLDNTGGTLRAARDLNLTTQALVNRASGASGGVIAGGALDLHAASLDNRDGYLASGGAQTLSLTHELDNRGGEILTQADARLEVGRVHNVGGTIGALGDISVRASDTLENRGGEIIANGHAELAAAAVDNGALDGRGGSVDAHTLSIDADTFANAGGQLRVAGHTTLNAARLNNTGGRVNAGGKLALTATALENTAGEIIADAGATVTTASASPGGTVASQTSVMLNISGNYLNTGLLSSQQDLTLHAANMDNRGTLTAGDTLTAITGNLTNSGEISAGERTRLNLSGVLDNAGLINGAHTEIRAHAAVNTGRIYGDTLRLAGDTVDNSGPGIIGAREALLIGAQKLHNRNHGLIYSAGDIAIRGSLDADESGQPLAMEALTNASSRIEAEGDFRITSKKITNDDVPLHAGIEKDRVIGSEPTFEYSLSRYSSETGSPRIPAPEFFLNTAIKYSRLVTDGERYPLARYGGSYYCAGAFFGSCDIDELQRKYSASDPRWALFGVTHPPPQPAVRDTASAVYLQWERDFAESYTTLRSAFLDFDRDLDRRTTENWYEYTFTRTLTEDQVVRSDPAYLIAGGKLEANADVLTNNSLIAAGQILDAKVGRLDNKEDFGYRRTSETGTYIKTEVKYRDGTFDGLLRKKHRTTTESGPYEFHDDEVFDLGTTFYLTRSDCLSQADCAAGISASGRNLDASASLPDKRLAAAPHAAPVAAIDAADAHLAPLSIPTSGTEARHVILTQPPQLKLPESRLFIIHHEPGAPYLVETDPAFTRQRPYLGADYFLTQLDHDSSKRLTRYGDGFYEQKLIDDQVLALTGRRFLAGHTNTEEQFKALMDAGVAFAKTYQLTPGVALSAAQMAQLTTDIVWLSEKTVTLADGSVKTVITPQLYLRRPQDGDLHRGGALIAGADVHITTEQDLTNRGRIAAAGALAIDAGGDLDNDHGTLTAHTLVGRAARNVNNNSGTIQGIGQDSHIQLDAGRDIVLKTLTFDNENGDGTGTRRHLGRTATVQGGNLRFDAARDIVGTGTRLIATDDLLATAGNGMRIQAVQAIVWDHSAAEGGRRVKGRSSYRDEESTRHQVSSLEAGRDLRVIAPGDVSLSGADLRAGNDAYLQGRNVALEAVKDSRLTDEQSVGKNRYSRTLREDETRAGGRVTAGKDITVRAAADEEADSGNIALRGAQLVARTGRAGLQADGNIAVEHLTTRHRAADESYRKHKNAVSSRSTMTADSIEQTRVNGSLISGESVTVLAGHDLNVQGSSVVGTRNVVLDAKNDIRIIDAQDSHSAAHVRKEKRSGFSTRGELSIGEQRASDDSEDRTRASVASTIGSVAGSIVINAGHGVTVQGSDLVAEEDIGVDGRDVAIVPSAADGERRDTQVRSKSGVSLGVSSAIVDTAGTVRRDLRRSNEVEDDRLAQLHRAHAGATAWTNTDRMIAEGKALANGDMPASIQLQLSVGASRSRNEARSVYSESRASHLAAQGDIRVRARGEPRHDASGNLTITGSQLTGGNVTLDAHNDIVLNSAANTAESTTDNSTRGWSAGAGVSLGQPAAVVVTASTHRAKGSSRGQNLSRAETKVQAAGTLMMRAKGDTTLQGAQVSGKRIDTDIGGDLSLISEQDTETYRGTQRSLAAGGSFAVIGAGGGASMSHNRSKVEGEYASVNEQTGFNAGAEGFDIRVGGHTQLKGAAIASAAAPDKNRLSSTSLGVGDVENRRRVDVSASGVSLNTTSARSGYATSKEVLRHVMTRVNDNEGGRSTTHAVISAGTVEMRDGDTPAMGDLQRDPEGAHRALQRHDMVAEERQLAERSEAREVGFAVTEQFTDEARRIMFTLEPKFYNVICVQEPCTYDPKQLDPNRKDENGIPNVRMVEISADEVKSMSNEEKTRLVVAVNGIFNSKQRAGELALQNADAIADSLGADASGNTKPSIVLMQYEQANNLVSELMIAGYEKFLAGELEYTNQDHAYANLVREVSTLRDEGGDIKEFNAEIIALGHSRGTLVQKNAFDSLGKEAFFNGRLEAQAKGPAVPRTDFMQSAARIMDVDRRPPKYAAFSNDPVPTFNDFSAKKDVIGSLQELPSTMKKPNSAHSCYGTGAVGCKKVEHPFSYAENGIDPEELQRLRQAEVDEAVERWRADLPPAASPADSVQQQRDLQWRRWQDLRQDRLEWLQRQQKPFRAPSQAK